MIRGISVTFSLMVFVSSLMHANAAETFKLLRLDGTLVKWGQPRLGTGASISYAIIKRARYFPDARNCAGLVPLSQQTRAFGIPLPQIQKELKAAFTVWESAANVTFYPAAREDEADILIGAQAKPRGRAYANVWYDDQGSKPPTNRGLGKHEAISPTAKPVGTKQRLRPLKRALICLNPVQAWKTGFDGDLETYDLRFTFVHEIGHALGLDHPASKNQLMHYKYDETQFGLQPGDVAGAAMLYGAAVRKPTPSAK